MKNKRYFILIGILLAAAAFWLLDFRLAASSTETGKLVMTTDMGMENLPVSMQQKEKISLVIVGDGPLVDALQKALVKELEQAGLGEIQLEQELQSQYQNPVLVVKVGRQGPFWTPIFALGGFSVHAGYDSSGDTTFLQPIEETHTSIGKPDAANLYAEYEVKDRSLGLLSRPGYHRYLAEPLAQEIVTMLKGLYHV